MQVVLPFVIMGVILIELKKQRQQFGLCEKLCKIAICDTPLATIKSIQPAHLNINIMNLLTIGYYH